MKLYRILPDTSNSTDIEMESLLRRVKQKGSVRRVPNGSVRTQNSHQAKVEHAVLSPAVEKALDDVHFIADHLKNEDRDHQVSMCAF